MKTHNRLASALLTALVIVSCGGDGSAVASNCGNRPAPAAPSGGATPQVASGVPSATVEKTAVIGVWSDCVRPDTVSVRVGEMVQWQAQEAGIAPELVLDDGSALGQVRLVLEVRFSNPGTYRYHVQGSTGVRGTIVVSP